MAVEARDLGSFQMDALTEEKVGAEVAGAEPVTEHDLIELAAHTIEDRVVQKSAGLIAAAKAIRWYMHRPGQQVDPERLDTYLNSLVAAAEEVNLTTRAVQFGLTEGLRTHSAFVDHSYETVDSTGQTNVFDVEKTLQAHNTKTGN